MSDRGGALAEVLAFALAAALLAAGHGLGPRRASPFEPGPRAAGEYRAVTWNVGGHDAGRAHALPDDLVPHVVSTLRALQPDLVVLQEVRGRAQVRALMEGLGAGWKSALAPGGGPRVAALARGGDLVAFSLDDRGPRALGLEHVRDGRAVTAVGLHAHAYSAAERNAAVGAACDALMRRGGTGPRLLLGDLNLDVDVDGRADLFTDDTHLDVETYNYVAAVLVDAALGNGSTAEPDRRLDYVFADARSFRVRAAGPWKGRRAGTLDHDPVVADLGWRE